MSKGFGLKKLIMDFDKAWEQYDEDNDDYTRHFVARQNLLDRAKELERRLDVLIHNNRMRRKDEKNKAQA